ncbi:MAG: hypothetical protein AABX54_00885 [Nanoarchaeota archaeon]
MAEETNTQGRLEKIVKTTLLKTAGVAALAGGAFSTYLSGNLIYNASAGNICGRDLEVVAVVSMTGLLGLYGIYLGSFFLLPKKIRDNMDDPIDYL